MRLTDTYSNFRRNYLAMIFGVFSCFLVFPNFVSGQVTVSITATNVGCSGGNTGAATATASGGWGPYTYLWSNGATTATITGLAAGTYSVTATDVDLGFASASVTITQGSTLGVSAFGESQICDIVPDGKATAVPFGGTPPYTYLWSNGGTTAQILHLAQGTYTVTVTDATGCTAAASADVFFWNEGLWIMLMIKTQISCFGATDAQLSTTVMSGTAPFKYSWSTGAMTTTNSTENIISNVGPGNYSVTVTDVNGCTHSQSISVSAPPELKATATTTPATCTSNGSTTVVLNGGVPPYSILWSNGSTSFTLSNLAPGTYTATAKDSRNCSKPISVTVTGNNTGLNVNATVIKNATCLTGGSAQASASAGSGNYSFVWDNGQNTATATNLTAGNHTVTATDASNGCTGTATVNIPQTGNPTATATVTIPATCTTGATATVQASGGTPPYSYAWSNGQTTVTATNLGVGSHSVVVTDAGGCKTTATVNVTAPNAPNVSVSVVSNATCLVGGSATATASGGSGSYVFLWDNGQTTATATNLSAGSHSVTVTDAAGCSKTGAVTITQSQGPNASAILVQAATCLTGGIANATATGGTTPYTFKWDNNQTTATATNLSLGNHIVTVTDANSCTATANVNVTKSSNPTVTATATGMATCNTGGTATASASGGSGGYTFKWDNNQTTANATNLSVGVHTVTVTDAGGCTGTANVTIQGVPNPTATISSSSNAKCDALGSATVLAAGGTPPYTYLWSNGQTTATAINLNPGTYTVTVTDAGGCKASNSVTIGLTNNGIKIGDFVWFDNNQDGFQDPNETGVSTVTVMLIKPGPDGIFGNADDISRSTTTNAQGKYEFDCVTPGIYILMFSGIPAGFEWTDKDKTNDCSDSDVKSNGKTDPFTIVAGQPNNFCFDAGIHDACDNVTMAGIVCCNQTICEGDVPATIYNVMSAGGGSGSLQYLWLRLDNSGQGGPTWVGTGVTTENFVFSGPLFQTTSYMRCARRVGCAPFLESNIVTITVKPLGSPGCGPFTQDLTVHSNDPTTVAISWSTNPESAAYLYTVQHSTDNLTWKNTLTVMGHQDSQNPNSYSALHDQPAVGKNFYRIKRADADNTTAFSNSVELDMNMSVVESMSIFPNPVHDFLKIKNLMAYQSDVTILITTTKGDVLYTLEIPAGEFKNFKLELQYLPAGLYFARVRFSKSEVHTLKITKF